MRVFTIPPSAPFLRTLAAALVDGALIDGFEARSDPERLAAVSLYVPTRRSLRLARDIFLEVMGRDAAILPRIVTLGAIDDDEAAFADADLRDAFDVPDALPDFERRLTLARMIAAWAASLRAADAARAPLVVGGAASALALAADLARMIDDMATRGVPWSKLDTLVPDEFDIYWDLTLQFLKIAREAWPAFLAERGVIEAASRRDSLIEAETARLKTLSGPVIAAGSTGSMPATARLLQTIAALPQGAVVLPGLDLALDRDAWDALDGDGEGSAAACNHPQFALHGLLKRLGLTRADVRELGAPAGHGRELLGSEAMRPAAATARWHERLADEAVKAKLDAAMAGVAVIAAGNAEMEALAIAVAMREAHAAGRSAALVTPDRALARRVMAALDRWSLPYDDSGGDALTDTPAGVFARLVADCAGDGFAPASLLALLKHPLLRLGRAEGGWRGAAGTLELALYRGPRPAPGSAGLKRDFAQYRDALAALRAGHPSAIHRSEPRAHLREADLDDAEALIARLAEAFAPLEDAGLRPRDFADLGRRHFEVTTALAADHEELTPGFDGPDGEALTDAFDALLALNGGSGLNVALADYGDVFATAFAAEVVRHPEHSNAALRIYGPLEARLTEADRVILGGLVETVWPPAPRSDPWLSRPMRHQLGLDLPERRVGLSAHDFAQMLGAGDVILTHAAKRGGAPAVASRFLHRLEAVAGRGRWDAALARGRRWLDLAEALDRPAAVTPIAPPQPRPPREARPLRLPVTAIEHWLRDPYTIFAKYILRLAPLAPVDMPPSAADRGSAIHEALGGFTARYPDALPDDALAALEEFGRDAFAPLMERPEARALWWPRFRRAARWFAEWERERRDHVRRVEAETSGALDIPLADGRVFRLTARADRIEHLRSGGYALLDYKTGRPPSAKQVQIGLSPQLTLEAAILRGGGFAGIAAGASVDELVYVRITGNTPPGEACSLDLKRNKDAMPPDEAADDALAKLAAFIREFDNDIQPFTSLDLAMWRTRYGDYDDLARIKEWSATAGAGEDA